MQEAAPPAGLVAPVLARDDEHRNRVLVRLPHRGRNIGESGARDREAHSWPAAGTGIPVGHESQPLFVAAGDMAEAPARQRAVELQVVPARNAQYMADAER